MKQTLTFHPSLDITQLTIILPRKLEIEPYGNSTTTYRLAGSIQAVVQKIRGEEAPATA